MDDKIGYISQATVDTIKPDCLAPAQIAQTALNLAVGKTQLAYGKLFVLSLLAGAYIGLGAMFFLLVSSDTSLPFAAGKVLGAFAFCTGLYLVITAGSELFTGDCLMVMAWVNKKISLAAMLKVLVVVWIGNLIGSIALALLVHASNFGALNAGAVATTAVSVAAAKTALPTTVMFAKAIMCNFMVCLAVWCSYATRTLVDKFFSILLPIIGFVACGFEHSVANMFFLPLGLIESLSSTANLSGLVLTHLNIAGICFNLALVTLGNIVGGAVLVGLAYYYIFCKKESCK